jgi:hypothetical protein
VVRLIFLFISGVALADTTPPDDLCAQGQALADAGDHERAQAVARKLWESDCNDCRACLLAAAKKCRGTWQFSLPAPILHRTNALSRRISARPQNPHANRLGGR